MAYADKKYVLHPGGAEIFLEQDMPHSISSASGITLAFAYQIDAGYQQKVMEIPLEFHIYGASTYGANAWGYLYRLTVTNFGNNPLMKAVPGSPSVPGTPTEPPSGGEAKPPTEPEGGLGETIPPPPPPLARMAHQPRGFSTTWNAETKALQDSFARPDAFTVQSYDWVWDPVNNCTLAEKQATLPCLNGYAAKIVGSVNRQKAYLTCISDEPIFTPSSDDSILNISLTAKKWYHFAMHLDNPTDSFFTVNGYRSVYRYATRNAPDGITLPADAITVGSVPERITISIGADLPPGVTISLSSIWVSFNEMEGYRNAFVKQLHDMETGYLNQIDKKYGFALPGPANFRPLFMFDGYDDKCTLTNVTIEDDDRITTHNPLWFNEYYGCSSILRERTATELYNGGFSATGKKIAYYIDEEDEDWSEIFFFAYTSSAVRFEIHNRMDPDPAKHRFWEIFQQFNSNNPGGPAMEDKHIWGLIGGVTTEVQGVTYETGTLLRVLGSGETCPIWWNIDMTTNPVRAGYYSAGWRQANYNAARRPEDKFMTTPMYKRGNYLVLELVERYAEWNNTPRWKTLYPSTYHFEVAVYNKTQMLQHPEFDWKNPGTIMAPFFARQPFPPKDNSIDGSSALGFKPKFYASTKDTLGFMVNAANQTLAMGTPYRDVNHRIREQNTSPRLFTSPGPIAMGSRAVNFDESWVPDGN